MTRSLGSVWDALHSPWRLTVSGVEPAGGSILAVGRVHGADQRVLRASLAHPLIICPPIVSEDFYRAEEQLIGHLRGGRNIAVFPEGERGGRTVINRGYVGMARLVMAARVPVVPVAIRVVGAADHGPVLPTRQLVVGSPLDFSRYWETQPLSDDLDGYLMRGIVDRVIGEIRSLAGVDYVDAHVTTRREYAPLVRVGRFLGRQQRRIEASRERRAELAEQRAREAEFAAELTEQMADELARAAEAAEIHARHDAAVDEAARRARGRYTT